MNLSGLLWRRKGLILSVTGTSVLLAFLVTLGIPDTYRATATVLITPPGYRSEISPKPVTAETAQGEIDGVQTAINMEAKTLDLYRNSASAAKYSTEKEFYEALAGQEREHQLILVDYYEYLKDPASWYTAKEHHSMDGG